MIHCGDCRDVLPTLAAESVQCCVTSPPYWGLRDYGTATWEGGDPACDHRQQLGGEGASSAKQNTSTGTQTIQFRGGCPKCGAVRNDRQLGLEAEPDEYVANLVAVFREVWRVLRPDGVTFLNLGDSYIGSGMTGGIDSKEGSAKRVDRMFHGNRRDTVPGYKQKDLAGIPWLVAFALRADGWWLRSDIIWSKPNPMPESVTDRPTKSHEYVFLLSKSERYFYDAEAIAEPAVAAGELRSFATAKKGARVVDGGMGSGNERPGAPAVMIRANRNARSVWSIVTQPFAEAHFATMPPELVRRCILAGTRPGDTVLDPFAGAGTTGYVAKEHGRRFMGIELNEEYIKIAERRMAQNVLDLVSA